MKILMFAYRKDFSKSSFHNKAICRSLILAPTSVGAFFCMWKVMGNFVIFVSCNMGGGVQMYIENRYKGCKCY